MEPLSHARGTRRPEAHALGLARRAVPSLTLAALAILVALPAASADHWLLYYSEIDSSVGATSEDDGEVVQESGNPLDGRANKVVRAGAVPGDGGVFLDARTLSRLGPGATTQGTDLDAGALAAPVASHRGLLLPGYHHTAAWYGSWFDTVADGIIRDIHDDACAPCESDEFVWRGLGSNEAGVTMKHYTVPEESKASVGLTPAGGFNARPQYVSGYANRTAPVERTMVDRTARENPEQGWTGAFTVSLDASLLASIRTVVVAGARPVVGGVLGVDLDDPDALVDVDAYEALNQDAASLWTASLSTFDVVQGQGRGIYAAALEFYRSAAQDPATAALSFANAVASDVTGTATRAYVPPDPKEPNTIEDDYGGHATFGGVGDWLGSYNTYDSYAVGHHLYFDAIPRLVVCAGAYAAPPGAGSEQAVGSCTSTTPDVLGTRAGGRTATTTLGFETYVLLWRDLNGDTHVGTVCERSSAAFDAERNTCRSAPYPRPHYIQTSEPRNQGESTDVCGASDARGGTLTLTPLGGPWPRVVVMRDAAHATRIAFDGAWEVREDSEPITLRWNPTCSGMSIRSRDALLFPDGGSQIGIRIETWIRLREFRDVGRGIDVADESVTDTDYLVAAL